MWGKGRGGGGFTIGEGVVSVGPRPGRGDINKFHV